MVEELELQKKLQCRTPKSGISVTVDKRIFMWAQHMTNFIWKWARYVRNDPSYQVCRPESLNSDFFCSGAQKYDRK